MIELKINSPKHGIFTILYSDEDRSLISKYTWTIHKTKWGVYARTGNSKIGTIPMHRMIMGCPDSFVDHINRNTLDNRRDNLRVVTITQSNIDTNAAIIVEATAEGLDITLPDPTDTTAGRLVYITAANGSEDFTLIANSGGGLGIGLVALRRRLAVQAVVVREVHVDVAEGEDGHLGLGLGREPARDLHAVLVPLLAEAAARRALERVDGDVRVAHDGAAHGDTLALPTR